MNQYEQPGLPQQTNRYNSDKTQIAAGSTNAAAQSPANSTASPGLASSGTGPAANQYNNLPYFVNPYYTYPYFMSNNYGNQKPYYGQQSYFNGGMEYRSQQGGPQQGTQQTPQQQPGAQQPGAQQGQQQGAVGGQNTLSGISDFCSVKTRALQALLKHLLVPKCLDNPNFISHNHSLSTSQICTATLVTETTAVVVKTGTTIK